MNVSQPQNDIPLPADMQKALENARNNVTVLNVETGRLTRLVGTLEKTISGLSVRESELKLKIEQAEKKLEEVLKEVSNQEIRKSEIEFESKTLIKKNEQESVALSQVIKEVAEEKSSLEKRERSLRDHENRVMVRETQVARHEVVLKEVAEELKQSINKL